MAEDGKLRWQYAFEWVIVPMLGVGIVIFALAGGTVPTWLIPLVPGFLLFPFARTVDRLRREK